MTWLLLTLASTFVGLLLTECFDWLPWLSRRVVRSAARYLPPKQRVRYEDEWLAELDAIPGQRLSRLAFAVRVLLSSSDTRAEIEPHMPIYFSTPVKRLCDLTFAGLMLVAVAPALAVIALVIKLTSSESVFSREERIGFEGTRFHLITFRTATGVWANDGPRQESKRAGATACMHESGHTHVGKFLCRTSLDQLPQILNVLKGDLSLIGPRPIPAADDVLLEDWHRRRHSVRPGVSGLWQVSGRAGLTFDEMMRLDLSYIDGWSLRGDLRILARTLPAALAVR